MSKLDRLISELTIQKQLFFGSIGVILGLIAWIVTNYESYPWWVLFLALLSIICSMIFGYVKHKRMYQLLEEIENVE